MDERGDRLPKTANEIRAARQSMQIDDRIRLERRQSVRGARVEGEIEAAYGDQDREWTSDLKEIEQRLSRDQGLRGFVRKLTGASARDREDAEALRKTLAAGKQRDDQMRAALDAKNRKELEELEARQDAERQRDERAIAERAEKAPPLETQFVRAAARPGISAHDGREDAKQDKSMISKEKLKEFAKNRRRLIKERDKEHERGR